jgi:hypothetical protein
MEAAQSSATQPAMPCPSSGCACSAMTSVSTGGSSPRKVMALGASQGGVATSTSSCAQGDST